MMRFFFFFFFFIMTGVVLTSPGQITWAGEETRALHTFSFPQDPMFFQPGPGQEIASTYCLMCHSADYIYTQPFHSQEKWQSLVLKMKYSFGCPIPDDQISRLTAYLFQQNSVTLTSPERRP